jgi:hypothetical protein
MLTGSAIYRSCNNTGSVEDVMPRLDSQVHAYERNHPRKLAKAAFTAAPDCAPPRALDRVLTGGSKGRIH